MPDTRLRLHLHAHLRRAIRQPAALGAALVFCLLCALATPGCGGDDTEAAGDAKSPDSSAISDGEQLDGGGDALDKGALQNAALPDDLSPLWYPETVSATNPITWQPGTHMMLGQDVRHGELRDVRGLIHAHSVFSHDACDGKPVDDKGVSNQPCLADFRNDLCRVKHDFIMLSDHPDRFADHEFPEVLLYDTKRGDQLQQRGGVDVANLLTCPDKHQTLLMAGCEGDTMPVGLEGHAGETKSDRQKAYRGGASVDSFDRLHKSGALVIAQHTEDWSVEQLTTLPFDGFEMYNVHNNMVLKIKLIGELISQLLDPDKSPAPDLILLPLLYEDPIYAERWGSVLAAGVHRVGTMGSDCHQNTLNLKLADGERVDRYRRLMSWFSNHLLVEPNKAGGFDDKALKAALKKGRLYGVFEVMGYAEGFDFHAREGGTAKAVGKRMEMGDSPTLSEGVELVVRRPTVAGRDPKTDAPELTLRILRARVGGFDVVAEAKQGDLRWTVDKPGAYRADVRMVPRHLKPWVGTIDSIATTEVIWIYANPIYVQ